MQDIRYYPVVDMDTDGAEKTPLFPVTDGDIVCLSHRVWLEEMVPDTYRLCVRDAGEPRAAGAFSICCPKCGEHMKQIGRSTDSYRLGLYVCSSCRRERR